MRYYTKGHIQIGDIQAFKQMIEDTHHKLFIQREEYRHAKNCHNFSHLDKYYRADIKIEATES